MSSGARATQPPVSPAPRMAWSGRHALAVLPDGGVLLDIETGGLYELNESGCAIWESLIQHGSREQATRELAETFAIPPEQAARDVAMAVASAAAPSRQEGFSPLWFHRAGDRHYEVAYRSGPVLAIDLEFETVRALDRLPDINQLAQAFRLVAAKVLSRDGVVLHASAVRFRSELRAFAGSSGAGKTTTARAFADAGCELVSEDLVVLGPVGDVVGVRSGAEKVIRRWATEAAWAVNANPGRPVECESLRTALPPIDDRLSRITFLSASRRAGDRVIERTMGMAWTAATALQNTFIGVHDPDAWRERLEESARIASLIRGCRGLVPQGLPALAAAVRRYTSNSTS
jgi:hypothetical protein